MAINMIVMDAAAAADDDDDDNYDYHDSNES